WNRRWPSPGRALYGVGRDSALLGARAGGRRRRGRPGGAPRARSPGPPPSRARPVAAGGDPVRPRNAAPARCPRSGCPPGLGDRGSPGPAGPLDGAAAGSHGRPRAGAPRAAVRRVREGRQARSLQDRRSVLSSLVPRGGSPSGAARERHAGRAPPDPRPLLGQPLRAELGGAVPLSGAPAAGRGGSRAARPVGTGVTLVARDATGVGCGQRIPRWRAGLAGGGEVERPPLRPQDPRAAPTGAGGQARPAPAGPAGRRSNHPSALRARSCRQSDGRPGGWPAADHGRRSPRRLTVSGSSTGKTPCWSVQRVVKLERRVYAKAARDLL